MYLDVNFFSFLILRGLLSSLILLYGILMWYDKEKNQIRSSLKQHQNDCIHN